MQIGDIDRCAVYVSLAPGMENPAGMDPPEGDAARCPQYTSSEEEQSRPTPSTEDRVGGKANGSGAIPYGGAAGGDQPSSEASSAREDCR